MCSAEPCFVGLCWCWLVLVTMEDPAKTRVRAIEDGASVLAKTIANRNWPPVWDIPFIVFLDDLSENEYSETTIEVEMKCTRDDKGRNIVECLEHSCQNPTFGTATTSSLYHASKHALLHADDLMHVKTKKKKKTPPPLRPLALSAKDGAKLLGLKPVPKAEHMAELQRWHLAAYHAAAAAAAAAAEPGAFDDDNVTGGRTEDSAPSAPPRRSFGDQLVVAAGRMVEEDSDKLLSLALQNAGATGVTADVALVVQTACSLASLACATRALTCH
jgi:hypothetical protein